MLKKSALTFSVLSEFIKKPLTFWHSSSYFGNFRSSDDKIDFKKHNECEAKLKKKIFYWGELIPVNSEVPEPLKRIIKDGIRQN